MNRLSIKLRVTIWYTLAMIVVAVIGLIAVSSFSQKILIRDSGAKLKKNSNDYIRSVIDRDGTLRKQEDFKSLEPGVYFALYNSDGSIASGIMPFEFADSVPLKNDIIEEITYDGAKYLTYTRRADMMDTSGYWVKGIISVADEGNMLSSVIKTNVIIVFILIIAAGAGGYFIMRHALKPVDKISRTAKAISESSSLSQRISLGKGNDEIYRLADTFDEMLDKIEKTLENEKRFTSDASHELRTPVAVINSECEYVLDCADDLDDAKESVQSIKRQSDKMSKLISELLMISRMDKNTQKLSFEEIDLSELLGVVCDEQEEIRSENITLIRAIPNNIHAMGDRMLLTRLFINLISNAFQYGKEGGKIVVTLEEEASDVIFSVSDDGIGIAKEDLPRIWERFYQADSARTNENGSAGLGLSMAKWIAEHHGGAITVTSEPGRGSKFVFRMSKGSSAAICSQR